MMEGRLLIRTETIALVAVIALLGGLMAYWGYDFLESAEDPIEEESDALSCSQKNVDVVSRTSNSTHFTVYLESTSGFKLQVFGDRNETVQVEEASGVQKFTVPVSNVSGARALFPDCAKTVDLFS